MTTTKGNFHPQFNDPDADLVIECKDGVKLRVHSYALMAHSEYFRAMPAPSASPVGKGANLIHMDCQSSHLVIILKMIDNIDCGRPNWSDLAEVHKIGERYQFKHIANLVRLQACYCIEQDTAVPIFKFAGSHDFPDLAKLAIMGFCLTSYSNLNFENLPLSFFQGVQGKFAASLAVAMAEHPITSNMTYTERKVRWGRISGAFDVLRT